MSIASEITRISGNVADAYTAANAKGATMPVTQNSDNLATTISTIQTGTTPTGTVNITSNGTHNVSSYEYAEVLVPTTAPAHYIQKNIDANGKLVSTGAMTVIDMAGVKDIDDYSMMYAYRRNTNISGNIDLSDLTGLSGSSALYEAFGGCTGITGVDFSSLTSISGNASLSYAFAGAGLNGVINFPSLTKVSAVNGLNHCFYNTGITQFVAQNLEEISDSSGQGNCFYYCFQNCGSLTSINLNKLGLIQGYACMERAFDGCTSLIAASFPLLETIGGNYVFRNAFSNNTSMTTFSMPKLNWILGTDGLKNICYGNTQLTTVDLSRLAIINASNVFQYAFSGCVSLTSLSFPSLMDAFGTFTNQFNNMLQGVTGCTVHFPSNIQSVIGSWSDVTNGFGGTNTTVLYDIISTITTNGTLYNQCSLLSKENYRAWLKTNPTLTDQNTVYTLDLSKTSGFFKSGVYTKTYVWVNGGTTRYTTKIDVQAGDDVSSSWSMQSPRAIQSVDIDIVYTANGTPAVNDTVYSDEGITSVGTITAVA